MTTTVLDIAALDAAYQSERQALVAAERQAELERTQRAAEAAARLGLNREAERLRAVQNHWADTIHPVHASKINEISQQCREWRQKVAAALDVLAVAFDQQPRLREAAEAALWEAARDAWVAHASNPRSSPQLAWELTRSAIEDLADEADLRTSSAIAVAREKVGRAQMREISTVLPSEKAFEPPRQFQKLDHVAAAEQWLATVEAIPN